MKKIHTIVTVLAILLFSSFSSAHDSTQVRPIQSTPVLPQAYPNLNDCIEAKNIKAILVSNNGGTWGWKQSNCPAGYMSYGLKSYVGLGLGSGEFNWHYYCCRITVGYDS